MTRAKRILVPLDGTVVFRQVAPPSGNRPIPVSGIAKSVRSVATKCEPVADTPTPPPMTIPSTSATYGLGKRKIRRLSAYSSR